MTQVVLVGLVAGFVAVPATASARGGQSPYVPPSISSASQYVESVPTAGGPVVSTPIDGRQTTVVAGAGGSASSVPLRTLRSLARSGLTGAATAELSLAGAPRSVGPAQASHGDSGGTAAGEVLGTAVGASGAAGVLFPVVLIACAVAISAAGVARLRRRR